MEINTSFTVLTSDMIGILLILTLYFSNRHRMNDDKDMKIISKMMWITLCSCIADPIVYYIDGKSGLFYTILIYVGASWLFLGNVCMGFMWVKFLTAHLHIPFSDRRKKLYSGLIGFAFICLLINVFYPIVFSAYGNIYRRTYVYWIFLVIAIFYIVDGLYLYINCRNKVGILKFFPVHVFILPVLFGVIVQAVSYVIAITWTSIAVAIAGIMTALKNEVIFTDRLTGLYNRVYLDYLQQQIYRKKEVVVSGVMVDLNGFKQINDVFGHSTGDEALIVASTILNEAFGEYGAVMRYAGDEFVVILNTVDEALIYKLIDRANKAFEELNHLHKKPYQLSASMGYAILDLKKQTMNEFMHSIDSQMYKNKLAYYEKMKENKSLKK